MTYAFFFIGYFLGSIPFGLVLTRLAGYGDIRAIGSGNIGATNVLRTGNKKLAALTLLLDGGKGAAAVALAQFMMTYDAGLAAAAGAFLGHLFPVWLKFKGGKGVATTLGILFALSPGLGLLCCAIWLAVAAIFRYSSLAALTAIGLSPMLAQLFFVAPSSYTEADGSFTILVNHHTEYLPALCGFFAVFVFYRHKDNIRRLLKGEELKIGKKKD
ncbi:MAG: glycerol-3-phosphate 1-O-acyltransferase PlsY [Proteobacteria bacterium]|nr:glycerol-3-phosphate 1-O-acyltransferase PlsY [Pseudomonadota bacterium]